VIEYLLDTNIASDIARHPLGPVAQRLARVGEHRVGISIIAAAELRFGVERLRSSRLIDQVDTTLALITILPMEVGCDGFYARIRSDLERKGTPIGANDMLIAAHALSLDAILVTDNVREFDRVEGLRVENWLR